MVIKMNRYIITREQLQGQEYIISALYDENKKMIEVMPAPSELTSILGSIYVGKVQNIVPNLNAAFIKISPDETCYLPLEDFKNPLFTKKISGKKTLVEGDELLVQVSKEAIKTKDAAVTTNLNFTGRYAVLTTGNRKLGVSSKLKKEQRTHYLNMLEHYVNDPKHLELDYGIIIRTNAADVPDALVIEELDSLVTRYRKLAETAKHKTCYSCLYQEASPYLMHLNGVNQEQLEEIVTDDRRIFEEICENYHIPKAQLMTEGSVSVPVNLTETKDHIRIRYYTDTMLSLSALYSVKANLDDALKERVWLKSGAYLIIQPTEALTVIDVNTGKNTAKKKVQENFRKVNIEAATEIARQLRLRNISGIIIVDFINLTSKEAQAELLAEFKKALRSDPVPVQLVDMTKLGLVEVTRKKVKKSLREVLP